MNELMNVRFIYFLFLKKKKRAVAPLLRRVSRMGLCFFLLFIIIGASATLDAVIKFSDAMILALVFPNMIGLLLLFPEVKKELARYLKAIGK